MSAEGQSEQPRQGSRAEELRGYLQAAGDLSAIARARLGDAAREALRAELEKAGGVLGLAGAEEVARLRRTVERLERRVQALEGGGRAAPPRAAAPGHGVGTAPGAGQPRPSSRRPPVRRPQPAAPPPAPVPPGEAPAPGAGPAGPPAPPVGPPAPPPGPAGGDG